MYIINFVVILITMSRYEKIKIWYKSLKGLRKIGVIMTAIMIVLYLFGPLLKAILAAIK